MKIDIITAESLQFEEVSGHIVDLYNESNYGLSESLNIKHKSLAFAARPKGVSGGIVVSQYADFPQFGYILFAAFEKGDQHKGHLAATLTKTKQYLKKRGCELVAVEVNPFDSPDVWHHLGFRYEGMVNLTPTLFTRHPMKLFPDHAEHHAEGLPIDAEMLKHIMEGRF